MTMMISVILKRTSASDEIWHDFEVEFVDERENQIYQGIFFSQLGFGLLGFAASGFVMGSFMFMSCMFLTARFSSSHCGQFATCPICQPLEQDEGDMEEKEKPVPQFAIYGPQFDSTGRGGRM